MYNNSDVGIEFNSIDEAVERYCDVIIGYQTEENSASRNNSAEYAKVDGRFTNNYSSIYDIYSGYMYLGD